MTLRPHALGLLLLVAGGIAARAQSASTAPLPQDDLNLRFADGIVAIAEDKVITVDEIRREISAYIPQLQRESKTEDEFNQRLEALENNMIQQDIDRVLIIKEFRKDDKRHIPDSFIDNKIEEDMADKFDNDRSKFLAYLRSMGETMKDYRRDEEEDIIYEYMTQQQRKSLSVVSPVRIEEYYKENKDQFYQDDAVKLRLIQFTRTGGESDDQLRMKAEAVISRVRSGEKFADLAKQLSQGGRRAEGGDWGWHPRSDLKPEFADAAFSLKKGECTPPIINSDGCFLLYVEDRKYAGIQPLDQVRPQIENILMTQMTSAAEQRWLERLRREGYVKHF